MTRLQIHRFFRTLAKQFDGEATIILTGAAAGTLLGSTRASRDIDFAIRLRRRTMARWNAVEAAIRRAVAQTTIDVNYAEDIDRWGMITLLDYPRHTRLYRRFGSLEVRLLDPAYWAIGKLTRYLDVDEQDLVMALRRQRLPWARAVRVWGRALRASPRSLAGFDFRQHVEYFLRTRGRAIWGRAFEADRAVRLFIREAGSS